MKIEFDTLREYLENYCPRQTAKLKREGLFEGWIFFEMGILRERAKDEGEKRSHLACDLEDYVMERYRWELKFSDENFAREWMARFLLEKKNLN
jgi:hypothetical protein